MWSTDRCGNSSGLRNPAPTVTSRGSYAGLPAAFLILFGLVPAAPGIAARPPKADPQDQKQAEFLRSKPEALAPLFSTLYAEGERNAVVNYLRLGVAAMETGYFGIAETALDQSLARIESVYANDPIAKKARSVWSKEAVKDFKGEPYERAMAYYYRGLLYLGNDEYDNARASFRAAEYQDTVAEKEEYSGDFAVMNLLAGWASHCLGDDGQAEEFYRTAATQAAGRDAFSEARIRAAIQAAKAHQVLSILEDGAGPRKTAQGAHSERLVFESGASDTTMLQSAASVFSEDISWQAETRGGRKVDAILEGKAVMKDGMNAAGDAMFNAGNQLAWQGLASADQGLAQAGQIGMVIGLVGKLASMGMKPQADARYWDSLPNAIHVSFGDDPYADPIAQAAATEAVPFVANFEGGEGACRVAWRRTRSAVSVPAIAPGNTLSLRQAVAMQKKNHSRDEALRVALSQLFPEAPYEEAPAAGR